MSSPEALADDESTESYILATTQAQFGDSLRVGTGNIWEEEFTGEDGATATGLTAGLWLFVRDRLELNRHVRVREGQQVEIIDYQLTVLKIDEDGIRLKVIPPPSPQP